MSKDNDKGLLKEIFGREMSDLFKTISGTVYITILGMTMAVLSGAFKDLLDGQHYKVFNLFPCETRVKKAIKDLDKFGRLFAPVKQVFRRFASIGAAIYIDLCTPDFAAVKITGDSVSIEYNTPAKFIRPKVQQPIGAPVLNAEPEYLELLYEHIHFKTREDFILFVSWLIGCMNSDGGYPVLFLVGEQGSAKSTTCRLIKDLLDASSVALRNLPGTEKELMIAADNDFILCFDNISKLTKAQSDYLCKIATGAGFTMRKLYTTKDEIQIICKNPIVINTINYVPSRQDLLDRSIIVRLDFIPSEDRKTEKELLAKWEHDRPSILGALCQAASAGLKNYDSVSERNLPRMADFAKWVIAAEENLPWEKGLFMETMQDLRSKIVDDALEADPVAMAVLRLMEHRDRWIGSATELLDVLETYIDQDRRKYPGFPKIHNQLSHQLSRVSAFLREQGVQVEKGHSGKRFIEITNVPLQAASQARKQAKEDADKAGIDKVTEGFKSVTQAQEAIKEIENQAPENEAPVESDTRFEAEVNF
jgi:putative DNA primase/helicase